MTDLLVLDADGVSKAAERDRHARGWLELASELQAPIVLSAATLAEVLRGVPRDVSRYRVINTAEVWPVDDALGRHAGQLLGQAGSSATVDALVAATAIAAQRQSAATRCVVLTSDPDDLTALLADEPAVRVVAI